MRTRNTMATQIPVAKVMIEGFSYPADLVPPQGSYERKVITHLLQHVYRYGFARFRWTEEKSGTAIAWLRRMVDYGPQHVLILRPGEANDWLLVRGPEDALCLDIDRYEENMSGPRTRPGPPPMKGQNG